MNIKMAADGVLPSAMARVSRIDATGYLRRLALATFFCALASMAWALPAQAGSLCYVDVSATSGTNTGSSWADAYLDLQSALTDANCTEVWVADGVYTPVTPASASSVAPAERAMTFNIQPGVAVYGGFAGGESQRSARQPSTNLAILSGDIDHNDANAASSHIDATAADIVGSNSYNVVFMDATTAAGNITASTILDGFIITAGNADGMRVDGGGLVCAGYAGHICNPTLANLGFSGNRAINVGGGLYNAGTGSGSNSSPTLTNVIFSGNSASEGGAMHNDGSQGGTSSPTLNSVIFANNTASGSGGAMENFTTGGGTTSPTLDNVTFQDNHADSSGGALASFGTGGGTASPTLVNVTFTSNSAGYGGAIYNWVDSRNGSPAGSSSHPILTNVTLVNNIAIDGGAIYNGSSGPGNTVKLTMGNVTFSGNNATGTTITDGGGAIFNDTRDGNTLDSSLTNVTFSGNSAVYGGAIYNLGYGGTSSPTLTNVILWGNTASADGGNEIFNYLYTEGTTTPSAATAIINYGIVQGGCPTGSTCAHLLTSDPVLGALANNGGSTETMLPTGVVATDAGTCAGAPYSDQRGVMRPQGTQCDIGAVEIDQGGSDRIFADGFQAYTF